MNVKHIPLFPTFTTSIECENYHSIRNDLIAWIYQYQKCDEGVVKTNRGGWQSKNEQFYFDQSFTKYYDYMIKHITSSLPFPGVNIIVQNMWININKKGNFNTSHDHPQSMISGVFWVKTPNECGEIMFESPKLFNYAFLYKKCHQNLKEVNFKRFVKFIPKEGTILLFPADLRHQVEPSQSDEDRISIAFNLWLSD
jgi:uncharacterized protein (TIGR02466 family)